MKLSEIKKMAERVVFVGSPEHQLAEQTLLLRDCLRKVQDWAEAGNIDNYGMLTDCLEEIGIEID